MRIYNRQLMLFLIFILATSAGFHVAHAAWWEFGKSNLEPEISTLQFNALNVIDVDEHLTVSRDQLEAGGITIRGHVELDHGTIGKVLISLDDSQTWKTAILGDRGMFTYQFQVEFDREYEFQVKAISTTGKSNDVTAHSFTFEVTQVLVEDTVKQLFQQLLSNYMEENNAGFMQLVHPEFEGDRVALEDAVSDDFTYFDDIKIEPNITNISSFDNRYEITFTFNRQVLSSTSGQLLTDASSSSMEFAYDADSGQYRLLSMASPLLFGISNPSEVATSINESAVGQSVIAVDASGNATTQTQSAQPASTQNTTISGSTTITNAAGQGFIFSGEQIVSSNVGDFSIVGDPFIQTVVAGGGVQVLALGNGLLSSLTQVPTTGYAANATGVAVGDMFSFQLSGGGYGIIEITNINIVAVPGGPITAGGIFAGYSFDYKYNPNGNTF